MPAASGGGHSIPIRGHVVCLMVRSMNREQVRRITTSILVPVLNEEIGLPIVLAKLLDTLDDGYEIIVIDDGSTDRTADVAGQFPCRQLRPRGSCLTQPTGSTLSGSRSQSSKGR